MSAADETGASSPNFIHRCGSCGRVTSSYRSSGVVCGGCGGETGPLVYASQEVKEDGGAVPVVHVVEGLAVVHNHPPGYNGPPDPHMAARHADLDAGDSRWVCVDCGEVGEVNDLLGAGGCTKIRGNCGECGCGPLCDRGCPEIARTIAGTRLEVVHVEDVLGWREAAKRQQGKGSC